MLQRLLNKLFFIYFTDLQRNNQKHIAQITQTTTNKFMDPWFYGQVRKTFAHIITQQQNHEHAITEASEQMIAKTSFWRLLKTD